MSKPFSHLYTRHVTSISATVDIDVHLCETIQAVFCVLTHEEMTFTADAKSSAGVVILSDNP